MTVKRESLPALAILLAVVALNLWGLRAELHSGGADLNDNVSHFRLVAGMAAALEHGRNPLDFWSPEWSFGFPLVRVYQPLAHLLVVAIWFLLGKTVSLLTVFVWFRFLALALLPVTFFAMARCFELPPLTAAAAALLAPLISTPQLYGLEYESYVWAGFGLFPQAVATHFLLLALGLAFRSMRRRGPATLAGIALGLTFLCQFVYGYLGALSVCLLALLPGNVMPRLERVRRVLLIGAAALLLCAFQLAPLWIDRALINPTPADQAWKSDSFGAGQVLEWLITGQLLDHGRLPVLSLLALAGAIATALRFGRGASASAQSEPRASASGSSRAHTLALAGASASVPPPAHAFALAGAAFWILVFFGRPAWGPLLYLLGVTPDLPLHRVLGGAQVFLVVLAAIGLSAVWSGLSRRFHVAAAVVATLAILYPMVAERVQYLDMNSTRLDRTLQAMQADRPALDALLAATRRRGGRAFAGLATANSWGPSFRTGAVPLYHVLAGAGLPTVGYLSHTMARTSDLVLGFDERDPAHYRLFDIQSFIVPAGTKYPVPAFLRPGAIFGRFQIFETPANGYFDLVDPPAGNILSARETDGIYQANIDTSSPTNALFKMTWHPNWKAWLDGQPRQTSMHSPGFVSVPVPPGRHALTLRYEPGTWKLWSALAGVLAVLLMTLAERRITR